MSAFDPTSIAPDNDLLHDLAVAAVDALPEPFRTAAREVRLQIEDFPDLDILQALQIEDPYELTGLYDGVPLTEKSPSAPQLTADNIFLYRLPILEEWISRGDVSLSELVTHVMVHELAHHFGWSDAEIARIDPWWE